MVKNFLFSTSSRPALGPIERLIQWVPRDHSPGVKRPGYEAEHSTLSSAEVKEMWIFTLSICLHDVVLNLLSIGTTLFT
jgi:hypothetical protein